MRRGIVFAEEGRMRLRLVECAAFLAFVSGCGTINYGRSEAYYEDVVEMETRAVLVPGQPVPDRLIVQQPIPQPPPPPQLVQAPPPQIYGRAPVMCTGGETIRVHDEVVDGAGGPAVIAAGNCVVVLSESIVRGAIQVLGNATVQMVESRIEGDISQSPSARVEMRGCRHRGGRFTM